jgi:hypothetical protein
VRARGSDLDLLLSDEGDWEVEESFSLGEGEEVVAE